MSFQSLLQFLLLLLYISINGGFSAIPVSAKSSSPIHFEMIHKHDERILGEKKLSRSESLKELIHHDKLRMEERALSRRMATQIKDRLGYDNSSFSLPIRSGAFAHKGNYFVSLKVGTPAQIFLLIVDTGSSLTWVNCKLKCKTPGGCPKKYETGRIFHSERSRTFRPVSCSTQLCRESFKNLMSVAKCPTPKYPCSYSYSYVDGSVANGIFAYESITITLANGKKKKLHDMLVGCSQSWQTPNPDSLSQGDGIFGLAYDTFSFGPNVFDEFHGKFSYCLMDRWSDKRVTNYLTFGNRRRLEMPPQMHYTTLGILSDSYAVTVTGIFVDGVKLNIPADIWNIDNGNGMILDSGSTLTTFVKEAYDPIIAALEKPLLRKFPKINSDRLEHCFSVINIDKNGKDVVFDESTVPKLEIEFLGGARFAPPVKSYFIFEDVNVNCLGFQLTPGEAGKVSILGNVMQQNHMWEFDPHKGKLGFGASTCELSHHHRF